MQLAATPAPMSPRPMTPARVASPWLTVAPLGSSSTPIIAEADWRLAVPIVAWIGLYVLALSLFVLWGRWRKAPIAPR